MRRPVSSPALSALAVFFLFFFIVPMMRGASAQSSVTGPIAPGARVVIAPMGGFETYFAAAVREKKVPITLTLEKDSAQYFLVSTDTEWQGFVYGAGGSANWNQGGGSAAYGAAATSTRGLEASIMLIDAKTKDVVWAYEVHKSSHGGLLLGTMAARGKQSVAEACAKHLKEFIEKNEVSAKKNTASSLAATPLVQHSASSSISPDNPTRTATQSPQPQPTSTSSAVSINSTPSGADIFVDDDFAGNTPSTLNLSAGKHIVRVRKSGFQEWVRSVNLYGGSITLNAELPNGSDQMHAAVSTPATAVSVKESITREASTNRSQNSIGVYAQNTGEGAVVTGVEAEGPGAKAGIQVGDVILALDGRLIKGKDFEATVAALKPGTQI
jgi:PEGA domain/PDZ domain